MLGEGRRKRKVRKSKKGGSYLENDGMGRYGGLYAPHVPKTKKPKQKSIDKGFKAVLKLAKAKMPDDWAQAFAEDEQADPERHILKEVKKLLTKQKRVYNKKTGTKQTRKKVNPWVKFLNDHKEDSSHGWRENETWIDFVQRMKPLYHKAQGHKRIKISLKQK